MPHSTTETSFMARVMAKTPGGESLITCLQCGTCGGSCPSGADMDSTPRRLFAMIRANLEEEVLRSNAPWYCVSCYYCMERCPQEIPITDLMYTLKNLAVDKGYYHKEGHAEFSESFVGYVEQYGRSFEFGLATRYHLSHAPLNMIKKSGLGFEMMQKGRLATNPDRIRNMPQLKAILAEARRIEAGAG